MKGSFLLSLTLFFSISCACQNLILRIQNIEPGEGHIQLMFYQNEDQYKTDKPWMIKRYDKSAIVKGKLTIKEKLKPGLYAVILLDDQNDSEEMEFNILGIPKEGFGFAGYYHKGLRRPDYKQFEFELSSKPLEKEISVKYF